MKKQINQELYFKMLAWLETHNTPGKIYYTQCTRLNLYLFKLVARDFYAACRLKVKLTTSRPKNRKANVTVRIYIFAT